ncbi:NAD(P)(+) transhydrogenase (Re/Si-specific) subunit alpha, partial [Gammaproteobacteria bacterium]|nr:NAD(P)(+) transhydrogenase (Re/Si-specific) subunit alpha [Gammaproteobacteria bacterium]
MIIAALKSPDATDLRSVIHPETVNRLLDLEGCSLIFERGIGENINVSDDQLIALGLQASSREECLSQAHLIITPSPLKRIEIEQIQLGATIIGMLNPFYAQDELKALAEAKLNAVSMEFIPRITRAQKMDVLSSQANLAGYAAVLEAAQHLSSALPMMMTAAGTLKPA